MSSLLRLLLTLNSSIPPALTLWFAAIWLAPWLSDRDLVVEGIALAVLILIGLLRAVGMSRSQVRVTVRWESVITSVYGAFVGVLMGLVLGYVVIVALRDQGLDKYSVPVATVAWILVLAFVAGKFDMTFPYEVSIPLGESPIADVTAVATLRCLVLSGPAVDRLKKVVDICHIAKVPKLCGPIHSAIGKFSAVQAIQQQGVVAIIAGEDIRIE